MTNNQNSKFDQDLCFLFYITTKEIVNRFNKYLKQYNISFPNYIVLSYIKDSEEIYVKTLCDKLHLDSGTISPIVKRLEKKNLVKRMRLPEDERKVVLRLTGEGTSLKKEFSDISAHVVDQLNLTEDEKSNYYNLMQTFVDKNLAES
ncbi:MarR family transcriptional regulator [Staphylococcus carnosus]|uniref:HTH-type transcriptional regulator SarZ n=1 Tax=Staphylococcus carnosus TaxID=1281 RepID=A0AAJ0JN86_STACA|nr:MarR family transcriptional regulator [Staphylococcus carnosus]KKB24887.1 transcriptional regulator [Staphylococcus carnosus]QQS85676.1 MarR family transcriptional regulator [Staphylococcus carnosus]UTC00967.1 transcriptional regulator [Staphylococcus carnosus]UTC02246.1 transcriptional regulator [Staphylococcus carnosus]